MANNVKGTMAIPHAYGRLQFGADLELHFRTIIGTGANPRSLRTMSEHIDVDVTGGAEPRADHRPGGDALIEMIIRTANGRATAAETLGHREFSMTKLYRSA